MTALGPPIKISFTALAKLLAKSPDAPAVKALLSKVGEVEVDAEFILAKQAGFELQLRGEKSKPKLIQAVYLYRGDEEVHGFTKLPSGFSFSDRSTLLSALPEPQAPVSHKVECDSWLVDGVNVTAYYFDDGRVMSIVATPPESVFGGHDISTHPLSFVAAPVDAPPAADLVAWRC